MKFKSFFFIIISLFIITYNTLNVARAAEHNTVPKSDVESILYNYGEVKRGDIISHDFIIRNKGNGELEIKDARPD